MGAGAHSVLWGGKTSVFQKLGRKKKQVPTDTAGRFCLLKVQKEAKVGRIMFNLAIKKKSKRALRWLSGKESACQSRRHGSHP